MGAVLITCGILPLPAQQVKQFEAFIQVFHKKNTWCWARAFFSRLMDRKVQSIYRDDRHLTARVLSDALGCYGRIAAQLDMHQAALAGGHWL